MAYSVEPLVVTQVVDTVLAQDATLVSLCPSTKFPGYANIFPQLIDQTSNVDPNNYPGIYYNWMGSLPDTSSEGGYRVETRSDWQFSVIGVGTGQDTIGPILQRVDALLQGLSASVPAGRANKVLRQSGFFAMPAPSDGKPYSRMGARYRWWIDAYIQGSTSPFIPPSTGGGGFDQKTFTATSGQTTFLLGHVAIPGSTMVTMSFGAVQVLGVDYNVTTIGNVSAVVFTSAVPTGQQLSVYYAYAS